MSGLGSGNGNRSTQTKESKWMSCAYHESRLRQDITVRSMAKDRGHTFAKKASSLDSSLT